LAGRAFIAYW